MIAIPLPWGMVCQVFWELGQTMAVISQMTIDWPEEAQDILAFATRWTRGLREALHIPKKKQEKYVVNPNR